MWVGLATLYNFKQIVLSQNEKQSKLTCNACPKARQAST
jgi:hypothetical protein